MKILSKINVLLLLFLLVICQNSKAQTKGFIGSKNAIFFDASTAFQKEIKFQYNVHIKKHRILLVDLARQKIEDSALFNKEGDRFLIDLLHTNNSIGIGFLSNNKKLNMPMPIGSYYGIKFERHWGTLHQTKDDLMLDSYNHQSNLPMIIFGRGIALNHRFIIDLSIKAGVKFGKYFLPNDGVHKNIVPPLGLYPQNIPFVNQNEKITEVSSGVYKYYAYYAMPGLKFGFLF